LTYSIIYDFTNDSTNSLGNNVIRVDSHRYAFFGGDVNQDGVVYTTDISNFENDAAIATFGYVPTDLTGDDAVDASDISLVENNAVNSVSVINP